MPAKNDFFIFVAHARVDGTAAVAIAALAGTG